jgi:hypothetical protein
MEVRINLRELRKLTAQTYFANRGGGAWDLQVQKLNSRTA